MSDVFVDSDLEEVMPSFLENRKKDIQQLKEALNVKDLERVRFIGHSLKGVGSGYGFIEVTNFGRAIEEKAKSNLEDELSPLVAALEDYMKSVNIIYVEEE